MKKFAAFLIAAIMCLCMFGCANGGNSDNNGDTGNNGGNTGDNGNIENPGGDSGNNSGDEFGESLLSKMDNLVQDFWNNDTMYDETVLMVASTDRDGNVTSAPKGKLMFEPTEIISVTQYNPTKVFAPADYKIEGGYLVANGDIVNKSGKDVFEGALPYVNDKAITGEEAFPGVPKNTQIESTDAGLYLPFCEDGGIVKYQLYVCYKHAPATTDSLPEYSLGKLKNLSSSLAKKNDIELFIYGDSISTGANSSGYLQLDPGTQPWFKLVQKNLASAYDVTVNLKNLAVGGWTSEQGVSGGTVPKVQAGLKAQFQNKLKDYYPDLAIIGFGMNDATLGVGIEKYAANTESMINTIRAQNPKCDIILLGTWLANPKAKAQSKNQTEYTQSLYGVAAKFSNVIVVDVGKVHKEILDSGKSFTETSSNNVNHPNDFTARMYAVSILKALVK